jgi:hypothetical protein
MLWTMPVRGHPVKLFVIHASTVLCSQAHDALQYRCPALKKAQGVLKLLQCRLADIVAAWEQGSLTTDGFTLQEVEGLVVALFEDTDYRAECLQRIEAAAEAT